MKSLQTVVRLTGMLLLVISCISATAGNHNKPLPVLSITAGTLTNFNGGCITSGNQLVFYEYQSDPVTATAATGGNCSGNYSYQWQWSYDNIFFYDIPGATGQNLAGMSGTLGTGSLPRSVYIHRRAVCGAEEQYTNSITFTYTNVVPVYARLEVTLSYTDIFETETDYNYTQMVEIYLRFYSDAACTTSMTLPRNINYSIRVCGYFEDQTGYTSGCSTPSHYQGTALTSESEIWLDDINSFEGLWLNRPDEQSEWELIEKWADDYELIWVDNDAIIRPPVYPQHTPGF